MITIKLKSPLGVLTISSLVAAISLKMFIPNLVFLYPSQQSLAFLIQNYLLALILLALISLFVSKDNKMAKKWMFSIINLTFIIWVHFNIKNWSGLINNNNFDEYYYNIDQYFSWILNLFSFVRIFLGFDYLSTIDAYHILFGLEFLGVYLWCFFRKKDVEGVSFGIGFILIIGAFFYCATPAFGPFIFRSDLNVFKIQTLMFNYYASYLSSLGLSYRPEFFVAPLAAMPSLHIAHSYFFFSLMKKENSYIKWFSGILVFYFFIEAVSLGWHYLSDLLMGVVLATIAYRVTIKVGYYV